MEYVGRIEVEDVELIIWRKSFVYEVDLNNEEIGSISIFKIKSKIDLIEEVNDIYRYYLRKTESEEE